MSLLIDAKLDTLIKQKQNMTGSSCLTYI